MKVEILKKRKIQLTILSLLIALFGIILLAVVFGIDQRLLKTPLHGKVLSTSGATIEGAEVSVQGQVLKTDKEGNFYFEDVNFGNYEVVVSKNGYTSYKNTWKINRFNNFLEISLKAEEFGEVEIVFNADGAKTESIEVKINSMAFPLDSRENGFVLNTGRLLTGTYLLEVFSPNYVDIEKRVEVGPGFAKEVIVLLPAADIVAEFGDYLDLQPLRPEKITVNGSDFTGDSFRENRLELKDLDLTKKLKIEMQSKGYLKQTIEVDLNQGLNSLGQLLLVPEKRVLITDRQFVKSAQLDGTRSKEVFRGEENCVIWDKQSNIYLVKCGNKTIAIISENDDYRVLREYNGDYKIFSFLPADNSLVAVSSDRREIHIVRTTSVFSVLHMHSKEIVSLTTDISGNIYFSDEDGVYRLSSTKSRDSEKVLDGRYFLQDITSDSGKILALSHERSSDNNMWLIDLAAGQSEKLSFLPGDYREPRFRGDNSFSYLEKDSLKFRELSASQTVDVLSDLSGYWSTPEHQIFFGYKKDSEGIVFATLQSKMARDFELSL